MWVEADARLEWVTPGHPLFEAVRREVWEQTQPQLRQGTMFFELEREQPALLELLIASVVDGTGVLLHRRIFLVETNLDGTRRLRDPNYILDLIIPEELPQIVPDLPSDEQGSQLPIDVEVAHMCANEVERLGLAAREAVGSVTVAAR